MSTKFSRMLACVISLGIVGIAPIVYAADTVARQGPVTVLRVDQAQAQAAVRAGAIDYANAQPMEMPSVPDYVAGQVVDDLISNLSGASPALKGTPGFSPGAKGDGTTNPQFVPPSSAIDQGVAPAEFGTSNLPFSTARADGATGATNTIYPYRASGRLFFKIGTSSFVCSASLIKRGVIVTAAHCVADFGTNRFHTNFQFIAGYRNGVAPFGVQTALEAVALTSYLNGTDPCAQRGVICQDDVAAIVLSSNVGNSTGFYGFGVNGFGFTGSGLTHITQIGYPVCLDNGNLMERNDAQGSRSASLSNNTVIGSLMCGGSSGGPWLVNFGQRPALTGTTSGTSPNPNIVVGTTSWQSSTAIKQMGASPFTSGNIVPIVNTACTHHPGSC